jgi:hypothetical protein
MIKMPITSLYLNFNNFIKVEVRIATSWIGKHLFYKNLIRMYKECQIPPSGMDNPELVINVGTDFLRRIPQSSIYDGFFIEGSYIYTKYRRKVVLTSVEILDIDDAKTTVNIRTNIFGRFIFPTVIINSLIGLKSNLKGICFVHGSSIGRDGKGVLLVGSDGSGKTSILIKSSEKNFELIADDATFVGNKEVHSLIGPMSLRYYHKKLLHFSLTLKERFEFAAKKILSILTGKYITLLTDIDIKKFFDSRLGRKAELKRIYYLTKGKEFRIDLLEDKGFLVSAIVNDIKHIYDFLVRVSQAYGKFAPTSYLSNYWGTLEKNLFRNITDIPCYKVITPFLMKSIMFEQIFEDMEEALEA